MKSKHLAAGHQTVTADMHMYPYLQYITAFLQNSQIRELSVLLWEPLQYLIFSLTIRFLFSLLLGP